LATLRRSTRPAKPDARASTVPPTAYRRSHRFDLASSGRQFLERRATEQRFVLPSGPERDSGIAELACIEGKYLIRRCELVHAPEVFLEERENLGTGNVVDLNSRGLVPLNEWGLRTSAQPNP
jgi:hypothetical protein